MIAAAAAGLDRPPLSKAGLDSQYSVSENFIYLDDITICASTRQELEETLTRLHTALTSIGHRINFDKSGWAVVGDLEVQPDSQVMRIHKEELPYIETISILGVDLTATNIPALSNKVTKRLQVAQDRLARVAHLPVGESLRAQITAASVTSSLNYMSLETWPRMNDTWMRRLSCTLRSCSPASWVPETSKEILWCVLHKGHLMWTEWARWYHLTKLLIIELTDQGKQYIELYDQVKANPVGDGILATFVKVSANLHIDLADEYRVCAEGKLFSLIQTKSRVQWLHELRDYIRLINYRRLERRRPREFSGIGDGTNRPATVKRVQAHESAGRFAAATFHRRWITGSLRSRRRYVEHGHQGSPFYCQLCHSPDDLSHVIHDCPRWSHLRTWSRDEAQHWPPCLRTTGIVPAQGCPVTPAIQSFLHDAPIVLLEYAKWVEDKGDDSWEWGPGGPQMKQSSTSRVEHSNWSLLVRRRLRRKQPRPHAYYYNKDEARFQMGDHLLRVDGLQHQDRGVPVFLKCTLCAKRRTHSRRNWFVTNACQPVPKTKRLEPRAGRWKQAVAPYGENWTVTWSHSRAVLQCMTCHHVVKPRILSQVPALLDEHRC